jgi:large subunit ribosomal protein L28
MSRVCVLSGKRGLVGNRVSHAKNRTKVRLFPNLQYKNVYATSLKKFVRLRISTSALRTINKIGLEAYCAKEGLNLK